MAYFFGIIIFVIISLSPTAVSEITGTLHAPQLPEAGVPVRLQFLGDLLRIEGAGTQDVMADTLEVSVIGFNDDTLAAGLAGR